MASYAFTDTERARQRLEVLSKVFAPSTRAFVADSLAQGDSQKSYQLVTDLGCGPGYTTHLLARIIKAERFVGLDNSRPFNTFAQNTAQHNINFHLQDITNIPFTTGTTDILYCRFLLTHLENPQQVITRWLSQLNPGGFLLMEEVEWIQTSHPTLTHYLALIAAMLAYQKNILYIGPQLGYFAEHSEISTRINRVHQFPVTTIDAAQMFVMNLQTIKYQAYIQEHYEQHEIAQLEHELQELANGNEVSADNVWSLRQIALHKPA